MPAERTSPSYPHIYDAWTTPASSWVIQDIPPTAGEEAMDLLSENMARDEPLCRYQKITEDPVSMHHIREYWRASLQTRLGLACYELKDGRKTLVALNACEVVAPYNKHDFEAKGEKWNNVYQALKYTRYKVDPFEFTGLDRLLCSHGLVVRRECRGHSLGRRMLEAREQLCRMHGVEGIATVCTGGASQQLAASCGYRTIAVVTLPELAAIGLPYPHDTHVLKCMVKTFARNDSFF